MGSKPNKNNNDNENVIINTQETVKINNLSPEIIKQNKSFENIIQKYTNNNNEEELKNFDSNNNDKNENLSNKNNSTDLITLVKNDIENTYNIAEE